ncbi:hypothetical protein [Cytobacillus horneckiae]|uniref:Uncharacterized protein n=1 Tax=Cytobacillus horneckiae TaxID=549687 RepID=A0A2N0ZC51_9BACI|nr:hypothetical protein [Cytobacillus horneckiae]MEC1155936.1 hypothetical protein [Cytobacillus horneckiae]MED2939788.1 hypothetical protein [Cytobacillus horneckiae]PKG27093.1 hypothetical protein CWS20_20725 [Cytobacillus horneckiae]
MRNYLCQLTSALLKIDAVNLACNLNKHGEDLWKAIILLENNEIIEEEFYKLVPLVDSLYAKEQERFQHQLENYFVQIHNEILELI